MKGEGTGRLSRMNESRNGSSVAEVARMGVEAYQTERAQSRQMMYWLIKVAVIAVGIAAAIIAYEIRGVVEVIKAPRPVRASPLLEKVEGKAWEQNQVLRPVVLPAEERVNAEPLEERESLQIQIYDRELREWKREADEEFERRRRESSPIPVRPEGTW